MTALLAATPNVLDEGVRGLDALLGDELAWGLLAAVAVVGAVVGSARRHGYLGAAWPLLVVAAVALGVRGRGVLPVLAAAAGWWLVRQLGAPRPRRPRWLLGATAATALGLFGTLPDVEPAVVLVGAVVVVAVATSAGWVEVTATTGPQVGALLGALGWVVVAGDGQRGRALLAGALCVVLLAVVAMLLQQARPGPVLAVHVVATVAASRWVGLAASDDRALLRALPVALVAALLLAGVARLRPNPSP